MVQSSLWLGLLPTGNGKLVIYGMQQYQLISLAPIVHCNKVSTKTGVLTILVAA